jgi:hypothetical protein
MSIAIRLIPVFRITILPVPIIQKPTPAQTLAAILKPDRRHIITNLLRFDLYFRREPGQNPPILRRAARCA